MEEEQSIEEQVQEEPLELVKPISKVLKIVKTLGAKKKIDFLSDNLGNNQYKSTVIAVAKEHKVPIKKGKEGKTKPT